MYNTKIATGLVRPKTTALFFDKIWIPTDLRYSYFGEVLGYSDIPDDVRFIEKREGETLKFGSFGLRNHAYNSVEDELGFLFSLGRNKSIVRMIKQFKKMYNIEIVPIFFDKTKFEKMILLNEGIDFAEFNDVKFLNDIGETIEIDKQEKKIINHKIEKVKGSVKSNIEAIEVCIKFVPEILEENLEWKQVLEIRKDKKSIASLRRFWYWFNIDLNNKNSNEINEILEQTLENYQFALKKHGVLTAVGGFSTILSSTSTFLTALSNGEGKMISAGLSISAAILTFSSVELAEVFKDRREPIAYIYNLNKMVVSNNY